LELLAKFGKTVTPAKAGVQKSLKNLDSGFRRNDEKGFLQKARLIGQSKADAGPTREWA